MVGKYLTKAESISVLKDPQMLLSFGFGSGLSPVMPGTLGTLMAVPFYILMANMGLYWYLAMVALTFGFGVYLCDYATTQLGVHDHGGIVWDEFVGFWITMIAAPPGWIWIVFGFLLFRLFDILKPWPISVVDKQLKGGFGIMFDDVLAGIAAFVVLQVLYRWLG